MNEHKLAQKKYMKSIASKTLMAFIGVLTGNL